MRARKALQAALTALLITSFAVGAADARPRHTRVKVQRKGAVQSGFTDKIDPGHFQLETNMVDWQGGRDQTVIIGDSVLRYGIADGTELQLGWTPLVNQGNRWGQGDLRIGGRKILREARFGVVVQPFVILPTGSKGFTEENIAGGATLGLTYEISHTTELYATPTVVLHPNTLYSGTLGLNQHIKGPVDTAIELSGQYERGDPTQTQFTLGSITTYKFSEKFELNAGVNVGLNREAIPVEVVVGFTRAF